MTSLSCIKLTFMVVGTCLLHIVLSSAKFEIINEKICETHGSHDTANHNYNSSKTYNIVRQGLYIISPSGKEVTHLQSEAEDVAMCPNWSNDHSKIAYCYFSDWFITETPEKERKRQGIYVKYIGKLHPTRITFGTDTEPSWSPDGKQIAYVRMLSRISSRIEVLNLATRKSFIFEKTNCLNINPTWSPDGSSIAFSSNRTSHFKIRIKKVGSSHAKYLANQPKGECLFPSWSRQNIIALCCQSQQGLKTYINLYVIYARGRDSKKLPISNLVMDHISWSPDGSQMVYTGWTNRNSVALYRTDALGTNVKRIHPLSEYANVDYWPDW